MPPKLTHIDPDDLAQRYLAGASTYDLAAHFNCSRPIISRRLKEAGVTTRRGSQATQLWWNAHPEERAAQGRRRSKAWQRLPIEERKRRMKPAHDASRGVPKSNETKARAARTKERRQTNISPLELFVQSSLTARGVRLRNQVAIGPYSCDLAAHPIAVEVLGGNWHFAPNKAPAFKKRLRYILDQGWCMLAIAITPGFPFTPKVADYFAAELKAARSDPAMVGQYRVIWGAGDFVTRGSLDSDHLPLVRPPRCTQNTAAT